MKTNAKSTRSASITDPHSTEKRTLAASDTKYRITDDGFYVRVTDGKLISVCSPLRRVGYVTNLDGSAPAHLVEIQTVTGWKRIEVAETLLVRLRELELELIQSGVRLKDDGDSIKRIRAYLRVFPADPLYKRVHADGWLDSDGRGGYAFGEKLYDRTGHSPIIRPANLRQRFQRAGDIRQWLEATRLLEHNPLLMAPLCFALAAPLLRPLGHSTLAISVVGPSSTGKSTALRFAQSLITAPHTLANWSGTVNGLRARAAEHNDLPLLLDEIGQSKASALGELVYDLINGAGKQRANSDGSAASLPSILTAIIAAGEESVFERMARAGDRSRGGHLARFITLRVDGRDGVVSDLQGKSDSAIFIRHLNAKLRETHGVAWPRFARYLARHIDELKERYEELRPKILEGLTTELAFDASDNIASRVLDHFAIATFAGFIGVDACVIDLSKKAIGQSMRACFANWLSQYSTTRTRSGLVIVQRVREFLRERKERILPLAEYANHETRMPPGYRYTPADGGEPQLLIRPSELEPLREEYGENDFHDALRESGWLILGSEGRPTRQTKIPKGSGLRFNAYAFRESFLGCAGI